ncbi:MAG: S8 family serine peptidase [Fimbriimonadaceae bacterium]|nr:S8 family serine peptidase [Fimbriimonadaceae bacterium]
MLATYLLAASTLNTEKPIDVGGAQVNPERLMVQVNSDLAAKSIAEAGYEIIRRIPAIGYVVVRVPVGEVADGKKALSGRPGIARADFDYAKRPAYTPNDPLWGDQWHMRTIKADLAWDLSFGTATQVALIDTGLEVAHPDLAANIWVNSDEIAGNGIDDDGNGYIDDRNGYDFVYLDPVTDDPLGHGTACAGLIGAVQDNNTGVTGVAPRARIMGLKCCNNSGYLYDSYLVPAYIYAAHNGARVLSMSYFSDRVSHAERLGIDYCWTSNIVPVAAAGNENTNYPYYPAAYENVVSVAATNSSDNKAGFSNFGTWVDVAAPGTSLTTTATGNGYTGGFAGTSGACPHVAGLATLLFGANPSATNSQVRAAIEDTATAVNQAPYGEYCNFGKINSQAAMNAILGSPAPGKSPLVRYITPISAEPLVNRANPALTGTIRIYGRGFQAPRVLDVTLSGKKLKVVARSRDWIDVALPPVMGTLVVKVDGVTVATQAISSTTQTQYPAVEACTHGATLNNGTFARMVAADGQASTCGRRDDERIIVEASIRRVVAAPASAQNGSNLTIRRSYTGGGTENIYLYNWSSASYPYGSFTLVYSGAAPSSMTTTTIPITGLSQFIDFEGSVYVYIDTTGVAAGGQLQLDQLMLVKPRT